jgi:hypothetical protein
MIQGQEKTRTERDVAYMTGLKKPELYDMLGKATQQQIAQPRATNTPPIWQGRARHGDYAEVLSRNPDGTFQVMIQGQEKTRTERDVAYMTGLKKGPLYEMLAEATQQQRQKALREAPEMLESRWATKPLPKGVSPEAAQEWRDYLESKRVPHRGLGRRVRGLAQRSGTRDARHARSHSERHH